MQQCSFILVNKTNRCTEFQFYWYYDSTCFGQPFCPSSGGCPKHVVVIPIKLEFNAFVSFIHKESVTMQGHMIVKFSFSFLELLKVHWFISTVFTDSYGDLNSQILRYFS